MHGRENKMLEKSKASIKRTRERGRSSRFQEDGIGVLSRFLLPSNTENFRHSI
jgi:hypothetical protein